MTFRNFTPFPHLVFESRDEQRRDLGVLVLRGTFALGGDSVLKVAPQQEPLVMADQHWGEPGKSSLRMENNIAPFKPGTDIHVEATAFAPGGVPTPSWLAGIDVGTSISKRILCTGPRAWIRKLTGWTLSEPVPAKEVQVMYENAFGGTVPSGQSVECCPSNPVGRGWKANQGRSGDVIPCPQILSPDQPNPTLGTSDKVEGLGPICPGWAPRLAKAGTFDMKWEKTRWPDLPEDFKFAFYNSAHPDLIVPGFLKGDETVRLVNLTPDGQVVFRLPGYQLLMLLRFEDGQIVPAPLNLDSLHINAGKQQVFLVWRGVYPMNKPLRVLEARMRTAPAIATKS